MEITQTRRAPFAGQIKTETAYFNGAWKVTIRVYERNAFTQKMQWVVKRRKTFVTAGGAKLYAEKFELGLVDCGF